MLMSFASCQTVLEDGKGSYHIMSGNRKERIEHSLIIRDFQNKPNPGSN